MVTKPPVFVQDMYVISMRSKYAWEPVETYPFRKVGQSIYINRVRSFCSAMNFQNGRKGNSY